MVLEKEKMMINFSRCLKLNFVGRIHFNTVTGKYKHFFIYFHIAAIKQNAQKRYVYFKITISLIISKKEYLTRRLNLNHQSL